MYDIQPGPQRPRQQHQVEPQYQQQPRRDGVETVYARRPTFYTPKVKLIGASVAILVLLVVGASAVVYRNNLRAQEEDSAGRVASGGSVGLLEGKSPEPREGIEPGGLSVAGTGNSGGGIGDSGTSAEAEGSSGALGGQPLPQRPATQKPAGAARAANCEWPSQFPIPEKIDTLKGGDVCVGTGTQAAQGKKVTVDYTGMFLDGKVFDSSVPKKQPFTFQLGAGQVIRGWDYGVAGMKVGGKRILFIPPGLAYGEAGHPPAIPPNSTLFFAVELLAVQ